MNGWSGSVGEANAADDQTREFREKGILMLYEFCEAKAHHPEDEGLYNPVTVHFEHEDILEIAELMLTYARCHPDEPGISLQSFVMKAVREVGR